MSEAGGDKTEAPTPKRRQEAARKGERPRAGEVTPALVLVAGATWVLVFGAAAARSALGLMRAGLMPPPGTAFEPGRALAALALPALGPFAALATLTIAAALGGGFASGARLRPAALLPDPKRLDPVAGLGRMFGMKALSELGKALAKVAVVGAVAGYALSRFVHDLAPLARAEPGASSAMLADRLGTLALHLALGLGLIALVDTPLAWFRFGGRLRMTKQEVRDEARADEGSPELKSAMRRRMREGRAAAPQLAAVAGANVVITNPAHFAVALRYRHDQDRAPVVVARGTGAFAAAIRARAAEVGVPALAYPELARAIYFTARAGREIDPLLYAAVAAVLAFVFGLERGTAAEPPAIELPPAARFDARGRRAA